MSTPPVSTGAASELGSSRDAVRALCDRYLTNLDRSRHSDSWLASVFTADARVKFPVGEYRGIADIEEFNRMGRARFERTHHTSSNHEIDVDGDRATVRAQLVAVHVPRAADPATHFDIGGHYDAECVRTDDGWRFRTFEFELVWTGGTAAVPQNLQREA